jgi:hypothetical protein
MAALDHKQRPFRQAYHICIVRSGTVLLGAGMARHSLEGHKSALDLSAGNVGSPIRACCATCPLLTGRSLDRANSVLGQKRAQSCIINKVLFRAMSGYYQIPNGGPVIPAT